MSNNSDLYSEISFDDTIINDAFNNDAFDNYTLDDETFDDQTAQSIIDISDDEAEKSNGGPIRNNKRPSQSSDVNEFFIRTKDSQKCRICAKTYSGISSTSTGTLKTHLQNKHPT